MRVPDAGENVEIIQGESGEFAGEDLDLGADVKAAAEDEEAFSPKDAEAA